MSKDEQNAEVSRLFLERSDALRLLACYESKISRAMSLFYRLAEVGRIQNAVSPRPDLHVSEVAEIEYPPQEELVEWVQGAAAQREIVRRCEQALDGMGLRY